jgi:hypothetical protein
MNGTFLLQALTVNAQAGMWIQKKPLFGDLVAAFLADPVSALCDPLERPMNLPDLFRLTIFDAKEQVLIVVRGSEIEKIRVVLFLNEHIVHGF